MYAATLHRNQLRKRTDTPYVSHLLAVASIVLEHGGGEDEAIGALLHDAAEDCGGRPEVERIRALFGEAVAAIVEGCTDTFETPKLPWRQRKEAYIAGIPLKSASTILVSTADKLHNARAILGDHRTHGSKVWERFSANDRSEIMWYYGSLTGGFGRECERVGQTFPEFAPLCRELRIVVEELKRVSDAEEAAPRQSAG